MKGATPFKPTKQDIHDAYGKFVPDVIADNLKLLIVGINPSLYSAAVGHHFARPGNRFWPALQAGGFTKTVMCPFDDARLTDQGIGITNLVERATARADELGSEELASGARRLAKKVKKHRIGCLAVLGVTAYRAAFGRRKAVVGLQQETLADRPVWILPNPSGLNAHYQLPQLGKLFASLKQFLDDQEGR